MFNTTTSLLVLLLANVTAFIIGCLVAPLLINRIRTILDGILDRIASRKFKDRATKEDVEILRKQIEDLGQSMKRDMHNLRKLRR